MGQQVVGTNRSFKVQQIHTIGRSDTGGLRWVIVRILNGFVSAHLDWG